jgi:hypothetical protein
MKFSTKVALLLAAATAACALAIPSMATAASWGVIGTEHTLDSPSFGFTSSAAGGVTSVCSRASLTTDVISAVTLTVTAATFTACTASGAAFGDCTETFTPTKLPWTITVPSTTNVQLHGFHVDVDLEDTPDEPNSCDADGFNLTLTGTTTGGHWNGNGANQHEIIFNNAHGPVYHSPLGNNIPVAMRATLRDTQQTLTALP